MVLLMGTFRIDLGLRLLAAAALSAIAACATGPRSAGPVSAKPHYKVGAPYVINGRRYTPREDPDYVAVGLASWYGDAFHGKPTANGETFDKTRISAAHKTLPLPSLVQVDNLENGRSIVVRVNDRGPFVDDRIIDMSEAAARALGFRDKGLARVRVSFVETAALDAVPPRRAQQPVRRDRRREPVAPAESPRVALAKTATTATMGGRDAMASLIDRATGESVRPIAAERQADETAGVASGYWLAVGGFLDLNAAQSATFALSDIGPSRIRSTSTPDGDVHTVFFGPYSDEMTAAAWRAAAIDAGYHSARIASGAAPINVRRVGSNDASDNTIGGGVSLVRDCDDRAGADGYNAC
ncbi:MAG: septal ring lytic transglycosylase RlpA family protein [Pseudomonadota bacterium]